MATYTTTFLPANVIAAELGLTHAWLVREAKDGRLPCIKMGRSTVFDLDQVREHLRQRAERQAGGSTDGAPA